MRRLSETRWFSLSRRELAVLVAAVAIAMGTAGAVRGISYVWCSREFRVRSAGERTVLPDRLDVNTATRHELTLLPGIGPKTAEAIVQDRQKHGPYGSLQDLERVSGIGPKTVEDIRPHAMCAAPDR
ncbi:MAG: ComEA family DNA-binding protein [Candidatus Brocadiia bacterium]